MGGDLQSQIGGVEDTGATGQAFSGEREVLHLGSSLVQWAECLLVVTSHPLIEFSPKKIQFVYSGSALQYGPKTCKWKFQTDSAQNYTPKYYSRSTD